MTIINTTDAKSPTTVGELLNFWRMNADATRDMGFETVARAYEECRRTLQAVHWYEKERPMTVEKAAEDCGYSKDHLYELIQSGKLRNIGEPGRPRVCRADLPRKPNAAEDRYLSDAEVYSEPL